MRNGQGFPLNLSASETFADGLCLIGTADRVQGKVPVSPSLYSQLNPSEFFLIRDADQKRQRLVKVRKTTYEDPGNPFSSERDVSTEVLLEQKPEEDSKTFMNRSSKWFLADGEVQDWLQKTQQAPDDVTWEEAEPSTKVPPVPPIPEDLKSSYVPVRAGWTKMKPRLTKKVKHNKSHAGGSDDLIDEKRDTAFYTPFHEIEDMYRDAASTVKKAGEHRSKR